MPADAPDAGRTITSLDLFRLWIGEGSRLSLCSDAKFAWRDTFGVIHCGCGSLFDSHTGHRMPVTGDAGRNPREGR